MWVMDVDFSIENEVVTVLEKENKREKQKIRRKSMQVVINHLRKCTIDRIFGKMGEC